MKPYNERLPLIDEAVEKLSGVINNAYIVHSDENAELWVNDSGEYYLAGAKSPVAIRGKTFCTRQEFETRAKELGWVNGYKYGVEYVTNSEKPDLPDDVEIEWFYSERDEWFGGASVGSIYWVPVNKFRICDERYKPVLQQLTAGVIQSGTMSLDKINQSDNLHERGELPPVGSKWKHHNGNVYTVKGYANEKTTSDKYPVTVIYQGENGNIWCRPLSDWHRSMTDCTERDKVIEAALSQDCDPQEGMLSRKDFCIKLYDAGMLKMPEDV